MRRLLIRAGAVLFGLLLAGLGAEAGLRLAGLDQSRLTPLGSFFEPDPQLGFRGRPGFSGRFRQSDFDVRVVHDELGFRRHERRPAQNPAAPTVYVLGDSFTWGYGVDQGCVYTDLVQDQLRDRAVRNLALCASGTVQQHALFERHIRPALRPGDAVVLAFYANDFSDNAGHCVAFPRLYAEWRDGEVREVLPRQIRWATWKKRLKDASCLVNFLATCADRLRERRAASHKPQVGEGNAPSEAPPAPIAEIGEMVAAGSPATVADRPEMKITEHYLIALRDACRAAGAGFLILYIPDPSEFGEHVGQRVAELADERRALLECATRLEIETLDLLPFLTGAKRRNGTRLTFPGDFHWNALGHQVAAEALARRLESSHSGAAARHEERHTGSR